MITAAQAAANAAAASLVSSLRNYYGVDKIGEPESHDNDSAVFAIDAAVTIPQRIFDSVATRWPVQIAFEDDEHVVVSGTDKPHWPTIQPNQWAGLDYTNHDGTEMVRLTLDDQQVELRRMTTAGVLFYDVTFSQMDDRTAPLIAATLDAMLAEIGIGRFIDRDGSERLFMLQPSEQQS